MDELESQVAKIQIGNAKQAASYVYILTEKTGQDIELYVVCELPLFNPAAEESCEKICLAIAGSLKRSFRRATDYSAFENTIAQINDELGKLAAVGQAHWIEKLNCIVAVKQGPIFHIATCGKIAAHLLRSGELTDISCSAPKTHPLKPFENVATGKIKLDDIVILSTTQLFNYLSVDRLKNILQEHPFPASAQAIISILKENAGPEVSFGSVLIQEISAGAESSSETEEIELSDTAKKSLLASGLDYLNSSVLQKKENPVTQIPAQPQISSAIVSTPTLTSTSIEKLRKLAKTSSQLKNPAVRIWEWIKETAKIGIHYLKTFRWSFSGFREMSPQKKFFFISVIVLCVAFFANIAITRIYNNNKQNSTQFSSQLQSVQDLVKKAESAILYKDNTQAQNYLTSAIGGLPDSSKISGSQKQQLQNLQNQINDLKSKLENVSTGNVTDLGSLGNANALISLPQYLAAQVGSNIISFDKTTQSIQDGVLRSSQAITASAYVKNTSAVVYNNNSLFVWNYGQSFYGNGFTQSVPKSDELAGLKYYAPNSKVYTLNKNTGQILSFNVGEKDLSKPYLSVNDADRLKGAVDLAIDGNIYVLTPSSILKYTSGKPAQFNMPTLFTPLSGQGKITTDKSFNYLYILDSGNNRILIINKKDSSLQIIKNDKFKNLKDFSVDEKNKTIYVLNDSNLLKVKF